MTTGVVVFPDEYHLETGPSLVSVENNWQVRTSPLRLGVSVFL